MAGRNPPPPPRCILRGHSGTVTALHFTNETDDSITEKPSIISGSDTGEIFIWSLRTQQTYYRFDGHEGNMIQYLCYYNSSLISQGRDGYIHEWKCAENQWNVIRSFTSANLGFCAAILFPTEAQIYLVTPVGEKSSMTFYDYETSSVLKSFEHEQLEGENFSAMCMCMNVFMKKTKMYVLMGFDGGFLSLWDYESGKEKSRLKCHPELILCLDYDSRYKNCGISGSVDDSLQVWKVDENEQLVKKFSVQITNPGVNAVKIRNDGKIVIIACQDTSMRVFSWKSLKPLGLLVYHRSPVSCLALNMTFTEPCGKDNSMIASGSRDENISVFSIY